MTEKRGRIWEEATNGFLKMASQPAVVRVEIHDARNLEQALVRRGLALEMADVLDFTIHESYSNMLMAAFDLPAAPGRSAVDFNQLLAADKMTFYRLALATEMGIRPRAGIRPLDDALLNWTNSWELVCALQQQPGIGQKRKADELTAKQEVDDNVADSGKGALTRGERRRAAKAKAAEAAVAPKENDWATVSKSASFLAGLEKGKGKAKNEFTKGKLKGKFLASKGLHKGGPAPDSTAVPPPTR